MDQKSFFYTTKLVFNKNDCSDHILDHIQHTLLDSNSEGGKVFRNDLNEEIEKFGQQILSIFQKYVDQHIKNSKNYDNKYPKDLTDLTNLGKLFINEPTEIETDECHNTVWKEQRDPLELCSDEKQTMEKPVVERYTMKAMAQILDAATNRRNKLIL